MKPLTLPFFLACVAACAADFSLYWPVPEDADLDTRRPLIGVPSDLTWLYNRLPGEEAVRAFSLGVISLPCEHRWRKRYRPAPLPRHDLPAQRLAAAAAPRLVCDLAIDPRSHGHMTYMEGVDPSISVWPDPPSTSVPYATNTKTGREFWLSIWKNDIAAFVDSIGRNPDACRLFAHAAPTNETTAVRFEFNRFLRDRFPGGVSEYNAASGESVASLSAVSRSNTLPARVLRSIQQEETFAELIRTAADAFAPVTVFFQPAEDILVNLDPISAFESCGFVSAPARTHTPRFTALLVRAIAKGRPTFSPEILPSPDPATTRDALLQQAALGYDIATLSPSRRHPNAVIKYGKDPITGKTRIDEDASAAAAKRLAQLHPEEWMNPFAVSPVALRDGLTLPKTTPARLAPDTHPVYLLHSRASERLLALDPARADGIEPLAAWADTLAAARLPTAVLLERDLLASGVPADARALLVPDAIRAALPGTREALAKYAATGALLLLGPNALRENPFGKPFPEAFAPTGAVPCRLSSDAVRILAEHR